MKYKKKRYYERKVFCRKNGGGNFQFKGGKRSPRGSIFTSQIKTASEKTATKSLLERMGFRVGAK